MAITKSWVEGIPLSTSRFVQHGKTPYRRKVTPLNYYTKGYPVKEVPGFTNCLRATAYVWPITYIGAQTGFAPFTGAYDKVYRKQTASGSKLISTEYPGPFADSWPGTYYYKFEQEWRGVQTYVRDQEADGYRNGPPRWIRQGEIEVRSRDYGPRYTRDQYGYNRFSGFGWSDWSNWTVTSQPYQSGAPVTVARTTQTTDFSKTKDYGGGVIQITTGSFVLTLSEEVDALEAALADLGYDDRSSAEIVGSSWYGSYYNTLTATGRKNAIQSVRSEAAQQVNYNNYSPHGAIGTPSVVRALYRLTVMPTQLVSGWTPKVRWDVVTRRNYTGGDILYGNAIYASTLVALERHYYDNEVYDGLHHYRLDESLTLESEITEFEDRLGKLSLDDPSWEKIGWVVIPGSGKDFGTYYTNYYTGLGLPDFLSYSRTDYFLAGTGQAWKLKVMVVGPPAVYRVRYSTVTITPTSSGGASEIGEPGVRELVWENDFFSPEIRWMQDFGDEIKRGVRQVVVHRQEPDGAWAQLKPEQFVLLYKLRTHTPWGWKPLRPVANAPAVILPWQQRWKIKKYGLSYAYQRPGPSSVGASSYEVDFAVKGTKLADDTAVHEITRNNNTFGGVTFPFVGLNPESFTAAYAYGPETLGRSYDLFRMYGGYFLRVYPSYSVPNPINETESPVELRRQGSFTESHPDYSYGSYFYKTRADPNGEIVETRPMSAVCDIAGTAGTSGVLSGFSNYPSLTILNARTLLRISDSNLPRVKLSTVV